jgi:RNA polymerase sigma-70 factor (ECF subfamily)
LEEAYRRYGPALLRKARRMLGSEADAQDIVQTVLIDLWRKRRLPARLPYLYRAVTTRCLNWMRDEQNRRRLLTLHPPPSVASIEGRALDRDLLFTLLDRLNGPRREVLVYRYFDDMQLSEIAALTGRSSKTISRWLQGIAAQARALAEGTP